MYRYPNEKSFRYKCGLYTQSCGARCSHNHVDGVAATRFLLAAIRQRILAPTIRANLEERIRQLAKLDMAESNHDSDGPRIRAQLKTVERDLERVVRNMAHAATTGQSRAMAPEFDRLIQRQKDLEAELRRHENERPKTRDLEAEVASAMEVVQQLPRLADDGTNLAAIGQLFTDLNARVFCRFQPVRLNKRTVNHLAGGVATFGNAPPPIEPNDGPTDPRRVKGSGKTAPGTVPDSGPAPQDERYPALEGKSLRNVSRGDRI